MPPLLVLRLLLAVGLLANAAPAAAQRLLDWNGLAGPAPAASQAPGSGAGRDAGRSWIRLQPAAGGWTAEVGNPLPAPVQVRLSMRHEAYYRAVPALPATFVLAAGERRALVRIYSLDSSQAAPPLDLWLNAVPGPGDARPDDALYRLPFAGVPVRIDQGFGGAASHRELANRYALDFALPVGTPVLAARAGRVIQVEAGFHEGGGDPALATRANLVRILHRDGSMAVYAHLAADSVQVRPGQWVEAGTPLADSGDTGFSTGPHLHFAVQVNAGMRLAAIPFRMAGPLGELRFPITAAGPDGDPAAGIGPPAAPSGPL